MTDEEKIESVSEALKKAEAIMSIWTNAQKAIIKNPYCTIAIMAQAEADANAVANTVAGSRQAGGELPSGETYIVSEAQNTTSRTDGKVSHFKPGDVKVVIKNDDSL